MAVHKFLFVVLVIIIHRIPNRPDLRAQSSCTGNLIREDLVLTAAHCFSNPANYILDYVEIRLLSGEVYRVLSIHIHPNYSKVEGFYNDLAIITCTTTELKTILELPNENYSTNKSCKAVGYGGEQSLNSYKVIDIKKNSQFLFMNGIIHLLFKQYTPCKGDSGGPLLCENKIYGILSQGSEELCHQKNVYIIYINVYHHLHWIQPFFDSPIRSRSSSNIYDKVILMMIITSIIAYFDYFCFL
ncbi:trypsin-4-like [Homalodisca vitripennis]|uniref:trypsin-4-like n=1 Tax=Homalodisca vitripennis TaxID=197043 RepID=UPI001EEA9C2C|nr:trypsin-4-like [Homalodisca vitripennis]